MALANCPSCGGAIEFKIGSSAVIVCDHCRSVVARTDRGLEDLGKVAALVETGSPLRRDLTGRIRGNGFRITGRTQMRHPMGGVWDEWYAAFDDGQWGWIAEAQGKYYLTVKTEKRNLPPYEDLQVGGLFDGMKVTELATATVISGEGEIPFRVEPGSTYPYADLSGANRRFGTIDYSEDPPLLFEGEEATLADLGIDIAHEPARAATVPVAKLSCSKCGGPLTLVAPDQSERVICPHCGAAHDVSEGNLRYLRMMKHGGPQPLIALASNGTIGGEAYVVAGFMQRSVTFDQKSVWGEYLLFAPRTKSFAWLVEDEGHWSFVVPLSAGDVEDPDPADRATRLVAHQKTFAIFQDAVATVESVIGEFYWKVNAGEKARTIDYIAPPEGITKEFADTESSHEISYSLARYMPPEEVEAAFGITGLARPQSLGTLQPAAGGGCGPLAGIWIALVIGLIAVSLLVTAALPHRVLLSETYHLDRFATVGEAAASTAPQPAPTTTDSAGWGGATATDTTATDTTATTASQPATSSGPPPPGADRSEVAAVIFTEPFAVRGGHNLKLEASTELSQSWLHVDGNLFNEQSGFVEPFRMQLENYEGVDGGEHWSEGSLSDSKRFSTMKPGTYSLRLETSRDASKPAPELKVTVTEGVFPASGCAWIVLAMILITLPVLISLIRRRGPSDSDRWFDAMFTPQGELNEDE